MSDYDNINTSEADIVMGDNDREREEDGLQVEDEVEKEEVSRKDVVLYCLCGILSDALPGFFFSATVIQYVSCGNAAMISLWADLGGLVGVTINSFLLRRLLSPECRVVTNAVLQVSGILIAWLAPFPTNIRAGITILTFGFVGMMATLLGLTALTPGKMATRAYQAGFSAAPVLGIAIVEINHAFHFGVHGLFGMAVCIPIANAIAVFCIDRSVWRQRGGSSGDPGGSERKAITDDDDNDGEMADANERDQQNADKGEESAAEIASTLSLRDYGIVAKEMAGRYWLLYLVSFGLNKLWNSSIQIPFFYSSSATYAGQSGEEAQVTADTILLVAHCVVFFIGISILTPLGRMLPQTSNPYLLWIPATIQLTIFVIVLVALCVPGAVYPPLPVWVCYVFGIAVMSSYFTVYLYTPLFVRCDKRLTARYNEFHIHSLFIVINVTYVIVNLLARLYVREQIGQSCVANYEEAMWIKEEEGRHNVSCTFFANNTKCKGQ